MRNLMNQMLSDYGITPFPADTSEAMVYIKYQPNEAKTYPPAQGLESGTMFPSLNKPFYGSKCSGENYD